ncbi:MAG: transporter [Ornithinimicrobium sp.]
MVALLVRLKLSLLRNTMRQSAWRLVGVILAMITGLGFLIVGVIGVAAARLLPVDQAGLVVVLGGSALVLGWTVLPVLLFGTDETLDPSRFALLPLSARQLLPGLLVAGAVGVPGVVTIGVTLATVVTWSRGTGPAVVALLGALLGILLCLLSARVLTSALAGLLSSRRFKDLASVALLALFMSFALGSNALSALALGEAEDVEANLLQAVAVVGWTPLGWAWSAPVDAASGDALAAAAKLALSLALVVALAVLWHHFLGVRLTSTVTTGSSSVHVRERITLLDRLLPTNAVGASAMKCLRYWRRDPRYIASIAGVIIAPVAIVLANVFTTGMGPWLIWMPALLAFVVGTSLSQDISYDGSAFWTQISSGIPGRVDLAGRGLAVLVWSAPLTIAAVLGIAALTDAWSLLPRALGLSTAMLGGGVGVGVWVTAHWQGPAPPPGASPFSSGGGTSFESFIAVVLGMVMSLVVAVPVIALVVGAIWAPALGWVALVLGPVWGVLTLRWGVRLGGARLDARWPEVLGKISANAG